MLLSKTSYYELNRAFWEKEFSWNASKFDEEKGKSQILWGKSHNYWNKFVSLKFTFKVDLWPRKTTLRIKLKYFAHFVNEEVKSLLEKKVSDTKKKKFQQ